MAITLHNRYTRTDTCTRLGMAVTYVGNRYKFVTVSIMKRLRNGRSTSETAAQQLQKRNGYLDPEVVKKIRLDS